MNLAERMTRIGIESAFEVLQKARALEAQGKNIVHLEIGQPDFPTPAHVKEAAKRALDEGWTGYGPTPGFPDFRQAIAGTRVSPHPASLRSGTSAALGRLHSSQMTRSKHTILSRTAKHRAGRATAPALNRRGLGNPAR